LRRYQIANRKNREINKTVDISELQVYCAVLFRL